MKLYAYQKKDGLTPACLTPDEKIEKPTVVELCEIDKKTYVALEEDAVAAAKKDAPDLIEVTGATVGASLPGIIETIKKSSVSVKAIRDAVIQKIRERYSVDDEIYFLRTAPSPEASEWNDYVESCRQWGREQKALLGL